ncbi:protein pitchfork isoform X1 [Notechis scutatus]|uniref:Protein pitchfork isoform X1 n=1 Tax=Notechis scutatus TaxID=8663 RepID=A0A6J1UNY9_9SAUR|nr:protein pitchfork isoform X1 [Notechis scutatus]
MPELLSDTVQTLATQSSIFPQYSNLGSNPVLFPWQETDSKQLGTLALISSQRRLAWELSDVQKERPFGTTQEKKIFPFHHAPDRLGNEFAPIIGDPDRGPGTYNHAERNNLIYNLAQRPQSTKGYSMGARTTPRFVIINKHVTPAPTSYQSIWIKEHKHKTVHFPFLSNVPRFLEQVQDRELFPGPGTYNPYKLPHRHVSWPGKFGSPDWSLVPMPQRRTFRAELLSDKEFKKYRNLVAYLSIYYSD